ncbi:conserved protein of unknown function [Tenacibaculum sp. 190524A02b]|uniref:DUF3179 domain-containing (seleno)protein n=1 Tax=Tenacibaculum vairaonense TaxID=3137860 RepID=UPI0032B2D82A
MRYLFLLVLMINLSCSNEKESGIINDFNNENNQWLVDESLVKEGAPFELIDSPKFKKPSEFDTVSDNELVLMFSNKGKIRVFPYIYLNYSEVVNDEIEGLKYVASYCPQTKSGICFQKNINGKEFNMFASGYLYKDNLVLTSKEDDKTFWSQMLVSGIKGNDLSLGIKDVFSIETTWKTVKKYFPEADVYYHNLLKKEAKLYSYESVSNAGSKKYLGIISEGIERKVELFSFTDFNKTKIKKTNVNGREVVVYGDIDKEVFSVFYIPSGSNLKVVNNFPIILSDERGNEWNIFGEAITGSNIGSRLTSPSFYTADLWAWNCFFKDEVTQNP